MPTPDPVETPTSHWYAALAAPIGIVVRSETREAYAQKLYRARKAACDPELEALSIILAPSSPNELWIIKRQPSLPPMPPAEDNA